MTRTYGGLRGVGVSYERGAPAHTRQLSPSRESCTQGRSNLLPSKNTSKYLNRSKYFNCSRLTDMYHSPSLRIVRQPE